MKRESFFQSMLFQKMVTGVLLVAVFVAMFCGILALSGGGKLMTMTRGGKHTKAVRELHMMKVTDPSDTKAIEALMYEVIDEVFLYRGWENDTAPFSVSVEGDLLSIAYNVCINRPDSFERLTADYSAIFLALIPKIRQIQWQYQEIQYGAELSERTLRYDWKMIQDEELIDASLAKTAKLSSAADFGASASALQILVNSFTYCDAYYEKSDKKAAVEVTEEQMIREIEALPADRVRSYDNMAKNTEIYVEGIPTYGRQEQNRSVWDTFCEKTKNGEPASIIIGSYNSLENLSPEEDGSVSYCNVHFDGEKYYALYDYVGSDRSDDFGDGIVTGKYLLSGSMRDDSSIIYHYITDDPSVSWDDFMYSGLYAGTYEFAPVEMVEAHCVMYEYKAVE